jgi:hypothetical protein
VFERAETRERFIERLGPNGRLCALIPARQHGALQNRSERPAQIEPTLGNLMVLLPPLFRPNVKIVANYYRFAMLP